MSTDTDVKPALEFVHYLKGDPYPRLRRGGLVVAQRLLAAPHE